MIAQHEFSAPCRYTLHAHVCHALTACTGMHIRAHIYIIYHTDVGRCASASAHACSSAHICTLTHVTFVVRLTAHAWVQLAIAEA
jgi:hypothetical protein